MIAIQVGNIRYKQHCCKSLKKQFFKEKVEKYFHVASRIEGENFLTLLICLVQMSIVRKSFKMYTALLPRSRSQNYDPGDS